MSIIEDSLNLSKTGRVVCGVVFSAGCLLVFWLWAETTTLPEIYRQEVVNRAIEKAIPSRPEELKTTYGGLPPKNKPEKRWRQLELKAELERIQTEIDPTNPKSITALSIKALLEDAMLVGAIHPQDAKNITEEVLALTTTDPAGG